MTLPSSPSSALLQDLYARMLLTRIVDDCICKLYEQQNIDFAASCRGHEAVQVGSALCIEVGKDFTLPYYRDLGVVLTIGMTPYEVFRTCLQMRHTHEIDTKPLLHWSYQKHNTITGTTPVATQILHAAGIAFACKLRKASVVTVAYCGDGAIVEPDFLEGIRFAALHQLPVIFVCEQNCPQTYASVPSCMQGITLPAGLTHRHIDGTNIITVYEAMQAAMQDTRNGNGPILLEMYVSRSPAHSADTSTGTTAFGDPLLCCERSLKKQGIWDDDWATQLHARLSADVAQALHDALRDTP